MDLFNNIIGETTNLLPCDGVVNYYGKLFPEIDANNYFNYLMAEIEWKNDEAMMFGKHIITKRKVAWYGNDNYAYTYSKKTKQALIWTKELLELKTIVEDKTDETFNSCLLNLYHDGNEGMAWHSDDEKTLKDNAAIASISFGAERKFYFKHKRSNQTIPLILENGSLLLMRDDTQTNWLHRLPTTKKVKEPRINLTFRTMLV